MPEGLFLLASTTTLSLSNLNEGEYHVNASVCGSGLCHNVSSIVVIDTTPPQAPQFWILNDGSVITSNTTILVGQGFSLRPLALEDTGSPLDNLHCAIDNGSIGSFELDISLSSWWNPWAWDASMDGVEATLNCTIRDIVNNSSPEFYTVFSFIIHIHTHTYLCVCVCVCIYRT